MKTKSIVVRLWTGIVLMTIAILFINMIFQTVYLYGFYYEEKVKQLKSDATDISKAVLTNKYNFNSTFFSALKSINDVIIVTDENSKITYLLGNSDYKTGWVFGTKYFDNQIKHGQVVTEQNRFIRGFQSLIVGVPIKATYGADIDNRNNRYSDVGFDEMPSNEIIGAVYIITPLEPLETTINIIRVQFLYIFVGAIIISSLIAYFLSQSFSKPLIVINEAAKQISKGNYNTIINLQSNREIKALGDTINDLAKQLSRVEQMRKEFIANVSHEMRTPLSYLQGYTEVLIDGLADTEEERDKYLNIIKEETERLRKMVDEILQLSQIEAGHFELKITAFSMEAMIKRTIDKLLPYASKRNISIKLLNIEDDLLLCLGDEARIKQVLINLLNNAINHSYDYGNIIINVYRQNDKIYICIRDFGEGIAEQDIPFIWDRFYTTNKAKMESGIGLGLAIVKNIVNAHGADVTVNSLIGEGTEFCFYLPAFKEI